VIVSNGPFAIRAVKDAAGTIPIVMSVIDDPVGLGFAQSLAHPGGNFTGLSNLAEGLVSKRLEMLLEVAETPAASRCCTIPGSQQMNRSTGRMADMQAGALVQKIRLSVVRAGTEPFATKGQCSDHPRRSLLPGPTGTDRCTGSALCASHGV
jgi:ABC transporter substrate binding protein